MRSMMNERRVSSRPSLESLEPRCMLTAANIGSFTNSLVLDPNNPKHGLCRSSEWKLGCEPTLPLRVPSIQARKQFEFLYNRLSSVSVYTTSLGEPKLESRTLITYLDKMGQPEYRGNLAQDTHYFASKDPGDYTITINVMARKSAFVNGMMTIVEETLTDTLTLTVEAPTVDWLRSPTKSNPQLNASPL